ncbi:DNA-binding protein [Streptomyces sp. NPDC088733]|uniref:DNA-binding protein n=1 Tax=Streptomyces sp. NPDC088733 TaxID=3365880 RepID=UPI0037F9B217
MPSEKYIKYEMPVPPADINADYMTLPETAHVMHCSVRSIRAALRDLKIKPKPGSRVITDKATRAAIYQLRSGGVPQMPRRRPRRRSAR